MNRKKSYNSTVVRGISIVAFLMIWQSFCMYNETAEMINPVFLPSPVQVFGPCFSISKTAHYLNMFQPV